MTSSNGRRGVNVSLFLANGNTIPSPNDGAAESEDYSSLEEDLARFTNVDFTDFDSGDIFGEGSLDFDAGQDESAKRQKLEVQAEDKTLDFVNGEFQFPGANLYDLPTTDQPSITPQSLLPDYTAPVPQPHPQTHETSPTGLPLTYPQQPTQPFNPGPYPGQKHHLTPPPTSYSTPTSTTDTSDNPSARLAAEEDKRRRNTAASARFRVKKKQREQALEKTAEELKQKAQELEAKVMSLQTENEWLRGLVVVRDTKVEGREVGERRGGEGREGVGTGIERQADVKG
ncbi:MAG: hypothetical protein Q9217_004163 [Psora testacea]